MTEEETEQKVPETPQVRTDAELIRENEMLRTKLARRDEQLKQAIDIANKASAVQQAKEDAEKQNLIDNIVIDSTNKWTPEELADKSLNELRLIKTTIDKSLDQTFAGIAALQAEKNRKKPPAFTIGDWDPETQTYKGGM